jgi:hypothetical protein
MLNTNVMMMKMSTVWIRSTSPSVTKYAARISTVWTPATRVRSRVPFFLSEMYETAPEMRGKKNNML